MTTNENKPEVFIVKDKWLLQTTGLDGVPQATDINTIREIDNRGKDGATLITTEGNSYMLTRDSVVDVLAALKGRGQVEEIAQMVRRAEAGGTENEG